MGELKDTSLEAEGETGLESGNVREMDIGGLRGGGGEGVRRSLRV